MLFSENPNFGETFVSDDRDKLQTGTQDTQP